MDSVNGVSGATCVTCMTTVEPLPTTTELADDAARRRILELESQVLELSERTLSMAARLAESQNEILELHGKLQQALQAQSAATPPGTPNRQTKPAAAADKPTTFLTPSPPQTQRTPSPGRFKAFFRPREQKRAANGSTSSAGSDSSLAEALSRETQLRKEAETKLSETTLEIEELTASLFSEANEMVASERRTRARLEERVAVLEKRDVEKKARLERLEKAVARVERVRSLVGEKRDSALSM